MRRDLRRGHITVPAKYQVDPIPWAGGLDYASLNQGSESFKWWLSCLGFLRVFSNADRLSPDDEAVCVEIIRDWVAHNPQDSPAISRAWDAHAVAYRTDSFLDVAERVEDHEWLDEILREHKVFLAAEENFQGNWNHGVDQSKSLINVAERLGDREAQQLGLARLESAMLSVVDDEGVTIEQAVHYDYFNYQQLKSCVEYLDGHPGSEATVTRLRARIEKMPDFLAHATRPDGTWFEIGDTPIEPAGSIPDTIAEFAATRGASGPRPTENAKTFSAGYIFGRSGWGENRPFETESAYSVRFGPGRLIHGHADNLSIRFVAHGKELIKDGGFHGYTDDENRAWLRSQSAHSTIIASRGRKKSTQNPSEVTYSRVEPDWQSYTITANPFEHTYVYRSIYIEFDPDVLVVWDRLRSRRATPFEQRWIIHPDALLTRDGSVTRGEGAGQFTATQHFAAQQVNVVNSSDAGAPLGATDTHNELAPNGSIQYRLRGRDCGFLTVFQFGSAHPAPITLASERRGLGKQVRSLTGFAKVGSLLLDANLGLVAQP
ncbi:hypothetical protein C7K25_06140 [Gulosibacter molinativorax]|uniref:Heparinase II/III-like C-terminal domain-containing protein n=1 Tax=Gulosibacter molinativorax TaxID=256821 RepID=A0ABT7C889_9MICO|nr:hypothetical protein [Gulosibacter molinativorax]